MNRTHLARVAQVGGLVVALACMICFVIASHGSTSPIPDWLMVSLVLGAAAGFVVGGIGEFVESRSRKENE